MDDAAELLDGLRAMLRTSDRGREEELQCETLLKQTEVKLDPSTPAGKALMDEVGLELPAILVEYMAVSRVCQESSGRLLGALAASYESAREIFTAFSEVISIRSQAEQVHLCLPLICGLRKIFPRIRRQTARIFRGSISVLIDAARAARNDDTVENLTDLETNHDSMETNLQQEVLTELIHIAKVIQNMCESSQDVKSFRESLVVFTLLLLTVVEESQSEVDQEDFQAVQELMNLVSFCTASSPLSTLVMDIDNVLDNVIHEDDHKPLETRLDAKRGAALAVYWEMQGQASADDTAKLSGDLKGFQNPGRPLVVCVLKVASTLLNVSCIQASSMAEKGFGVMKSIMDNVRDSTVNDSETEDDEVELAAQMRPSLETLQDFMILTPHRTLRQQGYHILLQIIKDVLPLQARFLTLQYLISNSAHPSLVCLLFTCVKDEVIKSWPSESGTDKMQTGAKQASPFLSKQVLETIQYVLRTREGQPAELPRNLEAVLGALNLYRFILIKESTGNTNYTHVLSEEELLKSRNYWLLPIREQVLRVLAAIRSGSLTTSCQEDEFDLDLLLSVVYRCLELVELQLQSSPR